MSNASAQDTKERIRQALNIVDVVGAYIPLRRAGRNFVGLCPWHDDSRPSFQVNAERQSFKCWVCDIGGDIFSFVQRMEKVEFPEALRMLAEKAGVPLEETKSQAADDRRLLQQACAWAEQQYHEALVRSAEASGARRYLDERGISEESIERFKLGFAPAGWDWLLMRARGGSYTPAILEKAGLASRRQNGSGYFDRFRGRVLFSIRDAQARAVGFGARILPAEYAPPTEGDPSRTEQAKYINTAETPLFSKSRLLYGLDTARDAMAKSRTALVMEGYTDCILAHQCGIQNAVAVLGTALGERHVELLKRYVDQVILVLDGDEAGRRRSNEILDLFVGGQVDLKILTLPNDLDPADFLIERGPAEFNRLLAGACDALEHKFRLETESLGFRSDDTHRVMQAVESVLTTLAKAPATSLVASSTKLREAQILQRISHKFGLSEENLRNRLSSMRRQPAHRRSAPAAAEPIAAPQPVRSLPPDFWDLQLLEVLLHDPQSIGEFRSEIMAEEIRSNSCRQVYVRICQMSDAGEPVDFNHVSLAFEDPAIHSLLIEVDEQITAKSKDSWPRARREVLESFAWRRREQAIGKHAAELRSGTDEQQQLQILQQILDQKRQRHAANTDHRHGSAVPMEGSEG